MRLTLTLLLLTTLVLASPHPHPQHAPPPTPGDSAYKRALHELKLKVKYPEFFKRADPGAEDPVPSHEVCVDICPAFPGEYIECSYVPDTSQPDRKMRKREGQGMDGLAAGREVLSPEHAARFFLGRGRYTHENGTHISDAHYLSAGEARRAHQMKRSRFTNWAVGKLGNMVMDLGIPVYKRWKNHYVDQPDYAFVLSDMHAFRMRDLPHIERALLDTQGWDEFEIGEWRVSRRFLEVASQI